MKDYSIAGIPRISNQMFLAALEHRNSPVTKFAREAYAILHAWGCDPAVGLGFFVHESGAGRAGAAVEHLNWGNLRSGPGMLRQVDGFALYASWLVSLNDWCALLRGPLYEGAGLLTVSEVTERYAPSADGNDPHGYAYAVNLMCAEWERLSFPIVPIP